MVIDFGFISNYVSPSAEAMPVFPDFIDLIRRSVPVKQWLRKIQNDVELTLLKGKEFNRYLMLSSALGFFLFSGNYLNFVVANSASFCV
tara:strand:- start:126 stop:392 length:267 start_codon:yes stop_codon:yes gene_type:complete